jgi:hypothetical protein
LHIPLDKRIKTLPDIPYTISYVIRKRQQIDSLSELGSEKMPSDELIWDGTSEELQEFIDDVTSSEHIRNKPVEFDISDVEGN